MQHGEPGSTDADRDVPAAVVARLPELLRFLNSATRRGEHTVSSDEIARNLAISSAMVRKDLAFLGFAGTRGVGYDVADLRHQIAEALGIGADRPVAIVGAGHLGTALASYPGFLEQGFRIAAAFDNDPRVIGGLAGGVPVQDVRSLEAVVDALGIRLAILAVPAGAAQATADRLVAAGVVSILNFAPVPVTAPDHVRVRRTDLAAELQILAFHARSARSTAGVAS